MHEHRPQGRFAWRLEHSKLEGQVDEVIEKIIQAARRGETPNLTSNDKELWDNFLRRQWVRSPKNRDEMQNPTFVSEALTNFDLEVRRVTEDEYEKFFARDGTTQTHEKHGGQET